jgi:hypothetical protein
MDPSKEMVLKEISYRKFLKDDPYEAQFDANMTNRFAVWDKEYAIPFLALMREYYNRNGKRHIFEFVLQNHQTQLCSSWGKTQGEMRALSNSLFIEKFEHQFEITSSYQTTAFFAGIKSKAMAVPTVSSGQHEVRVDHAKLLTYFSELSKLEAIHGASIKNAAMAKEVIKECLNGLEPMGFREEAIHRGLAEATSITALHSALMGTFDGNFRDGLYSELKNVDYPATAAAKATWKDHGYQKSGGSRSKANHRPGLSQPSVGVSEQRASAAIKDVALPELARFEPLGPGECLPTCLNCRHGHKDLTIPHTNPKDCPNPCQVCPRSKGPHAAYTCTVYRDMVQALMQTLRRAEVPSSRGQSRGRSANVARLQEENDVLRAQAIDMTLNKTAAPPMLGVGYHAGAVFPQQYGHPVQQFGSQWGPGLHSLAGYYPASHVQHQHGPPGFVSIPRGDEDTRSMSSSFGGSASPPYTG